MDSQDRGRRGLARINPLLEALMISPIWRRRIRRWHRLLGLVVALQVLLWVSGGLIMSSLDLEQVRGEHLRASAQSPSIDVAAVRVPVATILRQYAEQRLHGIRLRMLLGQPVYQLESKQGTVLVSALNGEQLSPLSAERARQIALADYTGGGNMVAAHWLETVPGEARGRSGPLWQLQFDDWIATTLYVSPATGAVVARRNNYWRVFDFVWMLHIMDYDEREDFNHPLLIIAAGTALLFCCTGICLLLFSFWPGARKRVRAR